jgi:hypothetical protein
MRVLRAFLPWGRCPQTPGIYRLSPEWLQRGRALPAPEAIPAAGRRSSTAWMARRDNIALGAGARAGEHRPASATGSGWHATGPRRPSGSGRRLGRGFRAHNRPPRPSRVPRPAHKKIFVSDLIATRVPPGELRCSSGAHRTGTGNARALRHRGPARGWRTRRRLAKFVRHKHCASAEIPLRTCTSHPHIAGFPAG